MLSLLVMDTLNVHVRARRFGTVLYFITIALLLSSCTYAISSGLRNEAVKNISFTDVRKDIDRHIGSVFIWGGFIVSSQWSDGGTVIEVVQNPIDRYGTIIDTDVSEGRFLIFHNKQVDPLIYEKDRIITVAGPLVGSKKIDVEGREYVYPLIEAREIYLWRENTMYPAEMWYWERRPYYKDSPWPYYPIR